MSRDPFAWTVAEWSNCRLKRVRQVLMNRLAVVEEEIDSRLGKGGGGLK